MIRHLIRAADWRALLVPVGAAVLSAGVRYLEARRDTVQLVRRDTRAHLGGEDLEHLTDLVLVGGIEERDVHFGTALALQIDRQQIGARGEQHPDDAAAVLRVAHLRRDHPKHTA